MSKATRDEVIAAFDEVIAERGEDWVYPQIQGIEDLTEDEALEVTDEWHRAGQCVYVKESGEYACVWGGVVSKVKPSKLPKLASTTDAITMFLDTLTTPDAPLRMAASWSQMAQDRGMPYGQVKEGFHRIAAMTADEVVEFDQYQDLELAGYPDPFN